MAITYQSISNSAFASRDGSARTITITKPTGLAAGDVMVAIIGYAFGEIGTADEATWTKIGELAVSTNTYISAFYKVATAGDASASDFTITLKATNGNTNDVIVGSILRLSGTLPITGASFASIVADANGGTTNNYTGGVSPLVGNSVLIMATIGIAAQTTVSNYAIATSNPTWTERQDTNTATSSGATFAIATAPRTESTATGNFSLDYAGAVGESGGVLIAVIEGQSVTVSPAVITMAGTVNAVSVTGSAVVSPAVISLVGTVPSPTVTTAASKWVNDSKSADPSWSNTNKS